MSDLETITLLGVIATTITAIIALRTLQHKKREGEERVIRDIIQYFVIPTNVKLITDKYNSRGFDFPNSLNLSYGISTEDQSFKRFYRRKRLLAWKILRYNKLCNKIDRIIGSLHANAYMHQLITSLQDNEGIQFELSEQNRNHSMEQLNEILMEYGYHLIDTINEIKKLQKRIEMKAKQLKNQLDKLVNKWKEKYNIV